MGFVGVDIGVLSPWSTQFLALGCSDGGIIRRLLALYELENGCTTFTTLRLDYD